MVLESQESKVRYQGNDLATEWPVPFPVLREEHLHLIATDTNGKDTPINSNYEITGIREETVSVTYPVEGEPLSSAHRLTIYREVPLVQQLDLENGGNFNAEVIERQFDNTVMQIQQIQEQIDRSVVVGITSDLDPSDLLKGIDEAKTLCVENAEKATEAKNVAEKAANEAKEATSKVPALAPATPENDGLAPKGGLAGQVFGVSEDGLSYAFTHPTFLGDIRLSPIPATMLPRFGWYAMNGDRYPIDSPVGQRLLEIADLDYMQEFLINCPIVQDGINIALPNWVITITDYVGEGGTSLGGIVMPFMRPINGPRQVGSFELDALQNITGYSENETGGGTILMDASPSRWYGAFYPASGQIMGHSVRGTNNWNIMSDLGFDASRIARTSFETRPANRGMTPCIYLGV